MGGNSLKGSLDACDMNRTDLEGSHLSGAALEGSRESQATEDPEGACTQGDRQQAKLLRCRPEGSGPVASQMRGRREAMIQRLAKWDLGYRWRMVTAAKHHKKNGVEIKSGCR